MASQEEPENIQVEVEREESPREQPPARAKLHPNTCPVCKSHYREDELRAVLRVCTVCGHHFPVGAEERVEQLADPGASAASPTTSARPTRSPSRICGPYTERLSEAEVATGLGDALIAGTTTIDGPAVRALHDGLRVHGRLDGQRRRRGLHTGERRRRRARHPARVRHLLGRRAHAGEHPRADADGEDRVRGRPAAGVRRALHLRRRAPDDRRCDRVVCRARRLRRLRAGCPALVRRPARRAGDDPRNAPARLRTRRVESRARAHRCRRLAPRAQDGARPDPAPVRGRHARADGAERRRRAPAAGMVARVLRFLRSSPHGDEHTNGGPA